MDLILFRGIVDLDRLGLDDDGGVTSLQILGLRCHRAGDIAGCEGYTHRYHDEQQTKQILFHNGVVFDPPD